jgi:hypothetical protein
LFIVRLHRESGSYRRRDIRQMARLGRRCKASSAHRAAECRKPNHGRLRELATVIAVVTRSPVIGGDQNQSAASSLTHSVEACEQSADEVVGKLERR